MQSSTSFKSHSERTQDALAKTGALKPEFINFVNVNSAEDSMLNKQAWIGEVYLELITLLKSPETIIRQECPNQALMEWCEKLLAKAFDGSPRIADSRESLLRCSAKISADFSPDSNEQQKRGVINRLLAGLAIEGVSILEDINTGRTDDQKFTIYLKNKSLLQSFILDKLALCMEYAGRVSDLNEIAIIDNPTSNRALINLLTDVLRDRGYSGSDASTATQIAQQKYGLFGTSNIQNFLDQKAQKHQGSKSDALSLVDKLVLNEFEKAIKVVRDASPQLKNTHSLLFDKDLTKVMQFLYYCAYPNANISNRNILADVETSIPESVKLVAKYFYQEAGFGIEDFLVSRFRLGTC